MNTIKIDKIIRSRRRSIGLEITQDASLVVRVPRFVSMNKVEEIIEEKCEWIRKKQSIMKKRLDSIPMRYFIDGEKFLFLGKHFSLNIVDRLNNDIEFNDGFFVSKNILPNIKNAFIKWYKPQAFKIFTDRVNYFAKYYDFKYSKIRLTNAKRIWGSCSTKNNLNISWRLIMAPIEVIDYVIVHELAHTIYKNHSKRFWLEVSKIVPDHKAQRKWLKENGHTLHI